MATDQNPQHARRPHYHRGRRGPDRRGGDRRPPAQQPQAEPRRDQLDIEQIMREIRTRIAERGVELSNEQIQELAGRRLEAILDPRHIKPSLMDELRRSAGIAAEGAPPEPSAEYVFDESTLYRSPSGVLRFLRRLLNPLLKLFFSPEALVEALNTQAAMNKAAATRDAEQRRRQAEWNGLHYEILRRLVIDIARTSIETQSLALRTESLAAKVDFNERRVRGLEQGLYQAKSAPRGAEPPAAPPQTPPPAAASARSEIASPERGASEGTPEGGRRRRRRRRGRRPGGSPLQEGGAATPSAPAADGFSADESDQVDDASSGDTDLRSGESSEPQESSAPSDGPESSDPTGPER